jgi:putative CocE/NonD family hydrolase
MNWRKIRKVLLVVTAIVIAIPVLGAAVVATVGVDKSKAWAIKKVVMYYIGDRLGQMPPYENDAQDTQTVMVAMRDGVELSTHVYLPEGKGPWPTIVVRDPYAFSKYFTCEHYVYFGYACVIQDVRGRNGSQGKWYPLVNERNDGQDLLGWVLKQPWQNGKIGLWGESYVGLAIWAMADKLPPEVKTFIANVSHGDYYEMVYRNGVFAQGVQGLWSATLFAPFEKQQEVEKHWAEIIARTVPATAANSNDFGKAWPAYHDYLLHPEKSDPYWHSPEYDAIRDSYKSVHVPVMLTDRWFDWFLPGVLRTYQGLPTKGQSVMVIGPGEHGGAVGDQKVEHPDTLRFANSLAWFDHYLKGKPLPDRLRPGYLVYDNGADRWQHHAAWPLPSQALTLYIDSLRGSQVCEGGKLSLQQHGAGQSVSYTYDPRHPVPTRGGSYLVQARVAPSASAEQKNDLCSRPDVLSFGSMAFGKASLISGVIRVKLIVASDAADTAFTVKLSEHLADGRVLNIRDDISTLGLRNGAQTRLVYKPNDKVEVDFELPAVSWQLQAGSHLRLDISSSNVPDFYPHPNRAGLWSEIADPIPAKQTIFSGSVEIPVAQ